MLPPLPRCSGWVYSSLISPSRVSLPRKGSPGRPAHRPFRGLLGVSGPATRRLQTFRLLHACSGCFRLERIAGWGLHPLESAALSRRTPIADLYHRASILWGVYEADIRSGLLNMLITCSLQLVEQRLGLLQN